MKLWSLNGPVPIGVLGSKPTGTMYTVMLLARLMAVPSPFGFLLSAEPPSRRVGAIVALVAVALSTLIVYPLAHVAPVVSLSVVYLPVVLVVSAAWGASLGIPTAVLSAAALNFFHLPPIGHFTLRHSGDWVALTAFLVVAIVASSIAEVTRARTRDAEERRQEADLAAEMARLLLRGDNLAEALPTAAARLAQTLELSSAAIEMDTVEGDDRRIAFPLREGSNRLGTLLVGLGQGCFAVNAITLRQFAAAPSMRAQATAVHRFVSWGALPAGSLAAGYRLSFLIAAGLAVLAAVIVAVNLAAAFVAHH